MDKDKNKPASWCSKGTTASPTDGDKSKQQQQGTTNNSKENNKESKEKPESKEDKFKQFEDEGVVFKAKLIGSELVMEPRGDKMCQNSIQRLKAIIKGQKAHKKRIVMKISYAGVSVSDEKTNELLYKHEVPQISFISSDDTDSRTFGYVCDVPNKAHQFICFKTSGPALQVMSVISSLFEAVLEKKKKKEMEEGEGEKEAGSSIISGVSGGDSEQNNTSASANNNNINRNYNNNASLFDSFDDDKFSQLIIDDKTSNTAAQSTPPTTDTNFAIAQQQQPPAPATRASLTKATSLQHTSSSSFASFSSPIDLIDGGDSGILESPSTTFSDNWPSASAVTVLSPPPAVAAAQQQSAQAVPPPPPPLRQQSTTMAQSNPIAMEGRADIAYNQNHGLSSSLISRGAPLMHTNLAQQQQQQQPAHHRLPPNAQNRSLVYNHSSVSLNESALSSARQSSLSAGGGGGGNESTDKYAVFNDIDNLPSIFESTSSLGSKTNLSNVGAGVVSAGQPAAQPMQPNVDYFSDIGPQLSGKPFQRPLGLTTGYSLDSSSGGGGGRYHQLSGNNSNSGSQIFGFEQQQQQQQPYVQQFQQPQVHFPSQHQQQQHQHQQQQYHHQFHQQHHQQPFVNRLAPTPSMSVAINQQAGGNSNAFGPPAASEGMIVGSAPMGGGVGGNHPMSAHARFSSSMVAGLHQRLGSSATSIQSVGSTGGLSRQTNPFDDDFFS